MSIRVLFVLITAFWVVMNVLLWRAEFGRGRETLSEVPWQTVVDRLLNAPDPSVLQITHHGVAAGTLRWIPTVEESRPDTDAERSAVPEGMVDATGYNLDLDLNLLTGSEGPLGRTRLLAHLDLNTNYLWQTLNVRLFQRPSVWELSAKTGEEAVHVRFEEGRNSWEETFRLQDLQQLSAVLGPYAALLPAPLIADLRQFGPQSLAPRLRWQARNDWIKIGRSRVRTYRVELQFMDVYQIVVQLSRAGEILQVKLPDGILLSNESIPFLNRN